MVRTSEPVAAGPQKMAPGAEELLRVEGLTRTFAAPFRLLHREAPIRAVDDMSFAIREREAFGLVGESGSGKTTIGRMVVRLLEPTAGRILFRGTDVGALKGQDLLAYRRQVQMVFQNPYSSLNPRRRIGDMLRDALDIHGLARGAQADDRLGSLMEKVGLRPDMLRRYPHQFSSGQRQRIVIARALSVDPTLVVADEPVSALDVSVQAQVLNLIRSLQHQFGLAVIFISHDLRAVSFLCDRVAVLYLGRVMEITPRQELMERPAHPYTQALFASIPSFAAGRGITREVIHGDIADTAPPPGGCVFAPRCHLRIRLGEPEECIRVQPSLIAVAEGHMTACHFAETAVREPITQLETTKPSAPAFPAPQRIPPHADPRLVGRAASADRLPDSDRGLPGPTLPQSAFPPPDDAVPFPSPSPPAPSTEPERE